MGDLLDVAQAQQMLLNKFQSTGAITIPLGDSSGRVLAQEVYAPFDMPLFPNSSMDGFAVRAADTAGADDEPVTLVVAADLPAGSEEGFVLPLGKAARIMTGAPLPVGADAVLPVEDTDVGVRDPGSAAPERIRVLKRVERGDFVRPKGQDIRQGELILQGGRVIRSQEAALLAMFGMSEISVFRKPRIALFSTGDELVPAGESLAPGQIYDSNSTMLRTLVQKHGGEPLSLGIVCDRAEDVRDTLNRAVDEGAELILTSAGVSVGAYDFVRLIVEQEGKLEFWKVNMRPGKPLAFGSYRGIPFIGLPGNPVSAFVGFQVFVRKALQKMAGMLDAGDQTLEVELAEAIESDGRQSYLRAILYRQDDRWLAKLTGHQGSGNLLSLVQANALLILPSGVKSLAQGTKATAWILD